MRTSPLGIALIHSFEQCRLTTYPDPGSRDGKPVTGGWGTTIDENGKPFRLGFTAPQRNWDRLFLRDLAAKEAAVNMLLEGKPTTQNQFDALVSFAYNVGRGHEGREARRQHTPQAASRRQLCRSAALFHVVGLQ